MADQNYYAAFSFQENFLYPQFAFYAFPPNLYPPLLQTNTSQ
jgi:hypothetical protein